VTGSVASECQLMDFWFVTGERDVTGAGLQWSEDADFDNRTVPVRPKTDPVEDTGYTHDRQVQATVGSIGWVCSVSDVIWIWYHVRWFGEEKLLCQNVCTDGGHLCDMYGSSSSYKPTPWSRVIWEAKWLVLTFCPKIWFCTLDCHSLLSILMHSLLLGLPSCLFSAGLLYKLKWRKQKNKQTWVYEKGWIIYLNIHMRVRQTYLLLLHQYSLWRLVSLSIGVIECCFCCCRCIVGVYCSEPTLQCPGKAALESVAGEVDTHWCVPTGRPWLPATAAATAGWGKWSCCQHPMCRETVL
jgi:hypothetical protein